MRGIIIDYRVLFFGHQAQTIVLIILFSSQHIISTGLYRALPYFILHPFHSITHSYSSLFPQPKL